jgi:hypothetical protein
MNNPRFNPDLYTHFFGGNQVLIKLNSPPSPLCFAKRGVHMIQFLLYSRNLLPLSFLFLNSSHTRISEGIALPLSSLILIFTILKSRFLDLSNEICFSLKYSIFLLIIPESAYGDLPSLRSREGMGVSML